MIEATSPRCDPPMPNNFGVGHANQSKLTYLWVDEYLKLFATFFDR